MPIILSVQSYRAAPLAAPLQARFDELGGTIGRSTENGLALDDPTKYISRSHARIEFDRGAFWLIDIGGNPSVVNGRPLGSGRRIALFDGDRLTVGEYQVVVAIDLPPAPPTLPPALSPFSAPTATGATVFISGGIEVPLRDELASATILNIGLAGGRLSAPDVVVPAPGDATRGADPAVFLGSVGDHVSPELGAWQQPGVAALPVIPAMAGGQAAPGLPAGVPAASPAGGAGQIPHDFDFLGIGVAPVASPMQAPAPVGLLEPAAAPVPPVMPVITAAPAIPATPAVSVAQAIPAAPVMSIAPVAERSPAPLAVNQPLPVNPSSPANLPLPVDQPQTTSSMQSGGQAPRPAPAPSGDSAAVLAALMRGLGLRDLVQVRTPEETAEIVGALLRAATDGAMGALVARALTKNEMRADVTMINRQANNPLKFFPDAGSALTQMLGKPLPGYMAPGPAYVEAFNDLAAHQLALVAGMRAALAGVLQRFDPAAIERSLEEATVMDKVLLANRKAKMWDRLVESYGQVLREADDDFQRLFGEQFAKAYEEQVARVRRGGV